MTTSRWSSPPTSSPRSSTTRTTGVGSPPPTRSPTSTRWAARRSSRSTSSRGRVRACPSSCSHASSTVVPTSRAPPARSIAGGHSIDDPEPKYGLAVVGTVEPDRVWRNAGGRPGDVLVLTKPIGLGVISTAVKREGASRRAARDRGRDHDHAQRRRARRGPRARRRGARRDRRHRLRSARSPRRARAWLRRRRARRPRRGARHRRGPRRSSATGSSPAARSGTTRSCRRSSTGARPPRTSSCSSPTRRPPAACCSRSTPMPPTRSSPGLRGRGHARRRAYRTTHRRCPRNDHRHLTGPPRSARDPPSASPKATGTGDTVPPRPGGARFGEVRTCGSGWNDDGHAPSRDVRIPRHRDAGVGRDRARRRHRRRRHRLVPGAGLGSRRRHRATSRRPPPRSASGSSRRTPAAVTTPPAPAADGTDGPIGAGRGDPADGDVVYDGTEVQVRLSQRRRRRPARARSRSSPGGAWSGTVTVPDQRRRCPRATTTCS